MNYVILAENDISDWADETGQVYHFPRKYYSLIQPGTKFIYYKGKIRDKSFQSERLSDEPHYFGTGIIEEIIEDKNNQKLQRAYFAKIINYKQFLLPVNFKVGEEYLEAVEQKNHFRDAVRPIEKSLFKTILSKAQVSKKDTIKTITKGYDFDLESKEEGEAKKRYVTHFERSSINRQKAIEYHGLDCMGCGINFERIYGQHGAGFIHVHHTVPISTRKKKYVPDIKNDFAVLCPNCHSMVHRRKDKTLTVSQLRDILGTNAISQFKEQLRYVNNHHIKHRYYEVKKLGELAHEFWEVCEALNIEYDDAKLTITSSNLFSIKNDCLEIRAKLTKIDANEEEKRIYDIVDYTLLNFFHFNERDLITKEEVVKKAFELKDDGCKNVEVFDKIKDWLFDEIGFDNNQLKHKFGFELNDPEMFNRFINKNKKLTYNK